MRALGSLAHRERPTCARYRSRNGTESVPYRSDADPPRIDHQRELLAGQPHGVPVVLPRELGEDDHVVGGHKGRRVEIGEIVQGEEHGDVEPLGQPLDGVGAGVATVGPDHVRALLLEEVVAGGQECLELLVAGPGAAVGRAEERHGYVAVRGEEELAPIGADGGVAEVVACAVLVQDVLDGHVFQGVEVRAAEDLAVEARLGQQLQGIEGGSRRAVGGIDRAVGRDEGDLAGLAGLGQQRAVAIHRLALPPVVQEHCTLTRSDMRTAVRARQPHVVAAAFQGREGEAGAGADQPLPVVPIGLPAALVKAAGLLPPLPLLGHAQGHDDVLQEESLGDRGGRPGRLPPVGGAVFVDVIVAEDQHVARVTEPADISQVIGVVLVVAVEEGEHIGPGGFDSRIAGRSHAAVLRRVGDADAAVGGGPALEDVPGVVGRAVVDGHEFPVGEFLLLERAQGAVEREGPVMDGHDDGDRGLHCLALIM